MGRVRAICPLQTEPLQPRPSGSYKVCVTRNSLILCCTLDSRSDVLYRALQRLSTWLDTPLLAPMQLQLLRSHHLSQHAFALLQRVQVTFRE